MRIKLPTDNPKTMHPDLKAEIGFCMWIAGHTAREIARTLGVHPDTIRRWKKSKGWESRKEKLLQRCAQETNRRSIEVLKAKIQIADWVIKEVRENAQPS